MKIMLDAGTQRAVDQLIDLLDIDPDVDLGNLILAAISRVKNYGDVSYERDELAEQAVRLAGERDRAVNRLEEALPIIHASHGGQPPLANLLLCVHPDCTRFHS